MNEHLTPATTENTEVGTHVLVEVGSGNVLRPGMVERFATKAAQPGRRDGRRPAVAIVFSWANGRVTHGRIFPTYYNENVTFACVYLAPEPHDATTVEILTNTAVA